MVTNHQYNDLAFLVRDKLMLFVEAQSTWSKNILLRLFLGALFSAVFMQHIRIFQQFLHELFRLAGGKFLALDVIRRLQLQFLIFQGQKRLSLSHGTAAVSNISLYLFSQV